MEFTYDGGGLAKGGDVTLSFDGKPVGKGRVERSHPMGYSADEACDVGSDSGSPASPDYGPSGNAFTGAIDWVQIDLGDDDHDHLITPRIASRSPWRSSRGAHNHGSAASRQPIAAKPAVRRGLREPARRS